MMAWLIAIGTPTALSLNVAQHFIYWCIYSIVVIVAGTVIDKIRVYSLGSDAYNGYIGVILKRA